MNVLAILPESIGGRLTTKSIIDGFIQNGCGVKVFDELVSDNETFLNLFRNNKFDFLLGYDYSAIFHKTENNLEIKTINYFSDFIEGKSSGEHHHKYLPELKKDKNYTFYWDKKDVQRLKPQFVNLFYLPHFVNTKVYYNKNLLRDNDIVFTGRLDTNLRLNNILELQKKFQNVAWYAIEKHFEDAFSRCDGEQKKVLKSVYKGFISTEEDMAEKLNKAKIVVNFHSQGKSAINYRTFQAMACGCVVISDFQEEMEDYFNLGEDLICYNDFDDMIRKIGQVLGKEHLYNIISNNAQKRINEEFNSFLGAKKMIDLLKG